MKKFFKTIDFTIWDKIAVLISLTTLLFASFVSKYADSNSLTVWSLNIWDSIFIKKDIFMFYSYTAENIYGL